MRRVDWYEHWNQVDTACVYIAKYGGGAVSMYDEPISRWPITRIARVARKISDMMDREHKAAK